MKELTSRERVLNAIERKPVDRLPAAESFWGETVERWRSEGHVGKDEPFAEHFELDLVGSPWINSIADLDFKERILEETDSSRLVLNGNGATLRWWKSKAGTPEHVDFNVKDRSGWEEFVKPRLLEVDRRRIPFEGYRASRARAAELQQYFAWAGVAPFEQMHPISGHEYMLMGMALDPDWVKDMVLTYAKFTIKHLEILFAEEGRPDGFFFYEDMGFKEKPFMSPAMYEEIVQPGHKLLFDYAHSIGCRVIVHSCGFVEPLVPGLIEAGMDCLQAMEVKAGMDLVRLVEKFGDRISFCGGYDIREMISNDFSRVDREFGRSVAPAVAKGAGYILHSDHSIPSEVDYATYDYFLGKGRAIRT